MACALDPEHEPERRLKLRVERTREAQGLPTTVTDPAALRQIAALVKRGVTDA